MVTSISSLKRRASQIWQRDDLPREFAWMARLSPLHYRLCLVELHAAVAQSHLTDDWEPVERLVEDWEATAQVDAEPELVEHLLSGDLEYVDFDPNEQAQ